MNDYSEIIYGFNQVKQLLYSDIGKDFIDCLYKCTSYVSDNYWENIINNFIENEFISWIHNTYIICFTEHNQQDDIMGRLSMWRTYGNDNGIAFVFNTNNIKKVCQQLNIALTPVAYLNKLTLKQEIFNLIESIKANQLYLKSIKIDEIKNMLQWVLRYAIVSIKHLGFSEEVEWRLVAHSINLLQSSKLSIESPHNIIQPIFKIPFDIFYNNLLDSIIISPTATINERYVKHSALTFLLCKQFNISPEVAESKIKDSDIPYRPI